MPPDRRPNPWQFASLGLELAGALGVLVWLGWLADGRFDTKPVWTLVGAFIGIAGGLIKVVLQTRGAVGNAPTHSKRSAESNDSDPDSKVD